MSSNVLKLPKFGPIIILLLYVVEDLIVGQDFLILIIVHRAPELEMGAIVEKLAIMLPTMSEGWNMGYWEALVPTSFVGACV